MIDITSNIFAALLLLANCASLKITNSNLALLPINPSLQSTTICDLRTTYEYLCKEKHNLDKKTLELKFEYLLNDASKLKNKLIKMDSEIEKINFFSSLGGILYLASYVAYESDLKKYTKLSTADFFMKSNNFLMSANACKVSLAYMYQFYCRLALSSRIESLESLISLIEIELVGLE